MQMLSIFGLVLFGKKEFFIKLACQIGIKYRLLLLYAKGLPLKSVLRSNCEDLTAFSAMRF